MEKKEIDSIVGNRLKELLDLKYMKQADLIRKVERQTGIKISRGLMSYYANGERSLPHKFAEIFSSILETKIGYLLGDDNFECNSYDEYVGKEKNESEFQDELKEIHKYEYWIHPLGYDVVLGSFNQLEPVSYMVRHRKKHANIPAEEMDAFLDDVKEYITMRIEPLMKKYTIGERR